MGAFRRLLVGLEDAFGLRRGAKTRRGGREQNADYA
jgi:hypothetical protein